MTNCLTCGGAIFDPSDGLVGWGGPLCYCQRAPRMQRRADEPAPTPEQRCKHGVLGDECFPYGYATPKPEVESQTPLSSAMQMCERLRAENEALQAQVNSETAIYDEVVSERDELKRELTERSNALVSLRSDWLEAMRRLDAAEGDLQIAEKLSAKFAAQARGWREQAEALNGTLEFYAKMQNFTHCSIEGEPESAETEFPNWMSGEGEYDIKDGTVAANARSRFAEFKRKQGM